MLVMKVRAKAPKPPRHHPGVKLRESICLPNSRPRSHSSSRWRSLESPPRGTEVSLNPGLRLCAHSYPGLGLYPADSSTACVQSVLGRTSFASRVRASLTLTRCCGASELGLNRCSSQLMPLSPLPPQTLPAPVPCLCCSWSLCVSISTSRCLPMSDSISPWACESVSLSLSDSGSLSLQLSLWLLLVSPCL